MKYVRYCTCCNNCKLHVVLHGERDLHPLFNGGAVGIHFLLNNNDVVCGVVMKLFVVL